MCGFATLEKVSDGCIDASALPVYDSAPTPACLLGVDYVDYDAFMSCGVSTVLERPVKIEEMQTILEGIIRPFICVVFPSKLIRIAGG